LEKLRHLPALLATWTIGVAAILNRREELLATVLYHPEWALPNSGHARLGPAWYLNPNRILIADGMHDMHPSGNGGRFLYPQSNWLKATLREPFRLVEPSDIAYSEACARFEFLVSMVAMDTDSDFLAYPWAGEFFLSSAWGHDNNGLANVITEELAETWPLLRAGAFGGQLPRAQKALAALTELLRVGHRSGDGP
jgi:hypothetical protein